MSVFIDNIYNKTGTAHNGHSVS